MGVVYRALDVKHARAVALKVVRPELGSVLAAERFLREIQLAAKLQHPHILPLYDSGEVGGTLYYVMPYVEGESLRSRLQRERQLPLEDALQITREVADALGYAHGHDVVHRDIKPENILLGGGHALVVDFGIGRAITAAGGDRLTESGISVGTPAYMSPEQGAGSTDIDGRSDIYSLACVLYEMLAGDPPFSGTNAQAILARKSLEPAPRLRSVRDTVPEQVERMVLKALARVPADRFRTATQFAEALASTALPVSTWRRILRRRSVLVGVGSTVLIGAAALGLWQRSSRGANSSSMPRPKVVVLPFENLGSPDDAWFADGITEEVTSRLAQISGLGVISRTSAIQYRGTRKTLHEIGAELGVQYVIEGTIRSDRLLGGARQTRVAPQLIRISDDTHLWADRYTVTLERGEIFTVQADIADRVARALDVTLLQSERQNLRTQLTENPEAYEAYLRGNQYAHGSGTAIPTDTRSAIDMYRRAVTLDPRFAEAHARLSLQYSQLWDGKADSTLALAQLHAERSLALHPDLAWGHLALAFSYAATGDWEPCRSEVALAEKLGGTSGEILSLTTLPLSELGDISGVLRNDLRALELDPLSADNTLGLGVDYFAFRRHAEAARYIERAIALAPDKPESYMYLAWLQLSWHGSIAGARAVLQTAVEKLGPERAFVAGFLRSYWWSSRLLAKDPWYRSMLERVSLGPPDLDSASYYMHKAGLFQGLDQGRHARAYWDSAAAVVRGRLGKLPGEASRGRVARTLHEDLGLAYAGLGNKESAIREAGQVNKLDRRQKFWGPLVVALMYAALDEREAAVEQFERILATPNFVTPKFLGLDPALAPLQQVPRFRRLVEEK